MTGLLASLIGLVAHGTYDVDVPVPIRDWRRLRVLDVGSGYNPRLIADVMVNDIDVYEGKRTVKRGNRFYTADATRLPFRDGAFDLAIANHVFEHLPDPAAALREMARVAHTVLVVTPSALREARGTDHDHFWFVYGESGRLVFEAIPPGFRHDAAARREKLERFTALENDLTVGDETVYHRDSTAVDEPLLIGTIDAERFAANRERYVREAAAGERRRQRPKKRLIFALKAIARTCIWAVRRPLDPATYLLPAEDARLRT